MNDPFLSYRSEFGDRLASPERIATLRLERFVPWPLLKMRTAEHSPGWRPVAHMGFVSNSRFAGGTEPVIERTNRTKTREFRKSVDYGSAK